MPFSTGIPFVDWFLGVLGTLGYLIVFGATVFENIFVLGSITPGETIVIAGAFVASVGRLSLPLVWLCSVFGTIVGSNISYWLGRGLGRDALVRLIEGVEHSWIARLFRITPRSVLASEQYFIDHGAKTVLVARFAAGVKNFVPLIAGVGRMSIFWFEVYTSLGAVIYTSIMVGLGWVVGANFGLALRIAGSVGWIGLLAVVAVVVFAMWTKRTVEYRRQTSAELTDEEERAPGT